MRWEKCRTSSSVRPLRSLPAELSLTLLAQIL